MVDTLHAETTILGAIMLDPNAFVEAAEALCPQDFALESNRRIFLRMSELAASDRAIDIVTLVNELVRYKEIESVGGTSYLCSLTEGLPRRPEIGEYIRLVKDRAVVRGVLSICETAAARANENFDSGLEIAAWANSAMETLIETGMAATDAATDAAAATVEALSAFERRRELEKDDTLPYGMMAELDGLTGGMFPGEMTVIGGESGVGKSSAMIQALVLAGKRNVPSVCFSLEMTRAQVLGRMWSILSQVPYRHVRFPRTATPNQADTLRNAAWRIGDWPLHIYDRASMTIGEICASTKIHIRRRGARLVCVDYLQRIQVPAQKEVRLQMSQAAMRLAMAVKGTPAHMMALSQLRRREDNTYPQMKDLRESGQIENEAHTIALLWREYDKEKGHHLSSGMVIVPKNRFGFSGNVRANFNVDLAIFE